MVRAGPGGAAGWSLASEDLEPRQITVLRKQKSVRTTASKDCKLSPLWSVFILPFTVPPPSCQGRGHRK